MARTIYTTPARSKASTKSVIPSDGGYTTSKSRTERLPKGAKADHVLSGAAELMRLLEGQTTIVKQNTVERIASLKSAPRINTVRTIIMQEVQKTA